MTEQITQGKIVSLHYTLTLDSGQKVDSSQSGEPLEYLHGANNIVPGLEESLAGKEVGDEFAVDVPPEKAYGQRDPRGEQQVPRSAFPDDIEIREGMQFGAKDQQGNVTPIWVTDVGDQELTVDLNHPLAGETLHFDVRVVSLRDATPAELQQGRPES